MARGLAEKGLRSGSRTFDFKLKSKSKSSVKPVGLDFVQYLLLLQGMWTEQLWQLLSSKQNPHH